MGKIKYLTLVYFIVLFISLAFLSLKAVALNNLLTIDNVSNTLALEYSSLQKSMGLYGISFFIVLLIIGLVLYYFTSKPTYILLSNIVYIAVVLFVFFSSSRTYFEVQNIDYTQKSEYWITIFMGIFYILGAVLVSAIGYITVRNYTKRSNSTLNKK